MSGNVTLYALSGAIQGYDTITASISTSGTTSTFRLSESQATSSSTPPFVNLGLGCSITQTGDETCSVAVDDHVAALNEDNAVVENVTLSQTSAPIVSENYSGSGSAYVGGLNSTKLARQGAYGWTVTGGSLVTFTIDATETGTVTYSDGSSESISNGAISS